MLCKMDRNQRNKKTNFEVHDIDKYIVERKIQEILVKTFFIYITQAKRSFCGPF